MVPARASSPTRSATKHGVCNLCEAICGLLITVEDGAVTGIRGNPADPLSRGHICPKGTALADVHEDPDRLRRPLRKVTTDATSEGAARHRWEEIGWREAIELAVEGLAGVQDEHGRDSVAVYLGNPTVHSLGGLTHAGQAAKSLRSRNVYSATSVDQLPQQLVAHLLYGHQLMIPVPDIDRTELLLVFGGNPMASNGSLWTVPDFPQRLRDLKARGGRMVVLDPRRTETAKAADEHHFVRPGTDAAVLLAMVHTLLEEGLATPPTYVDGIDRVHEVVADLTPQWASEVSGVPEETITRLSRDFARAGAAAAYGRMGVSTQAFGTVSSWAIHCLNALGGHLDRPGGMMFSSPAVDIIGQGVTSRGAHGRWRSRVRDLPETSGELPVATLADEMLTPGPGQVRGLLTASGNPVLSTPDGKRLDAAMEHLDFMVAIDIYLNETTRHADVILPPTTLLERDHYDLVFHALAVRNTARFTPALFPKPDGARHDWEIFRDLALGLAARVERRSGRRVGFAARAKRHARLRTSPTLLLDLLLRRGPARLSVRRLRRSPDGVDLGPLEPRLPQRLQTRDKRVDLAQPLVLEDAARLREAFVTQADRADGDLLLIGRRHQRDNNSWMHNSRRLTKGRPRHRLLAHPDDLAARGLEDGDRVEVVSRVGSVEVEVLATDDVMRGVVSLPHGYGHGRPGTRMANAAQVPGASINDLTDPELLDVSGNSALNGVPVMLRPARDQHVPPSPPAGLSDW
jgi:anaerobic selenocysteine-containing dehydrogenase